MAGENRDGKEKAYEKWVEKQQNDNFSSQPTSQESWDLFWKNCYYKTNKEEDESKDQGNANLPKAEDLESLQRLISKFSDLYKTGTSQISINSSYKHTFNTFEKLFS